MIKHARLLAVVLALVPAAVVAQSAPHTAAHGGQAQGQHASTGSTATEAAHGAASASGHAAPPADAAQGGRTPAALAQLPIETHTLDNGLRVVLSVDHTVPTVAIAIYYNVGSRNEARGRAGFAHLFEHMMFQGSANVAKGEHFKLIMDRGGSVNGSTTEDRTNYYETLPSNDLALGLWLEADRMRSLAVNQTNFENQRQTVLEERRQRYENQPYMMSMIRINHLAYGDYWPYAHSTIGRVQDLMNAPLSAVQHFWRAHYAPNNAVVSIAGDFDPEHAMQLVKRYFGDVPRRDVEAYHPPALQPQTAERTDTMVDPLARLPAFHIAWHIPKSRTPDHYPLELMSLILGDGESSRLYQELVEQKEMVQQIDVSTDDRRGPDLFSVWAIAAHGHTGPQVRDLVYHQIEQIAQHGVTDKELQKAKNRVRAAFIFGLQTHLSRAMQLAEYEMYWGDANLMRTELGRYESVTADDIKRVAGQYFAPTNRSVLDVLPPPAQHDAHQDAAAAHGGHR